jgi:hypothetical protein
MVDIEIVFGDFFRIESREDLKFDNEALVAQMAAAKIARKVQHESRILPEGGAGYMPKPTPKGRFDCKQKS